MAWWDQPIKDAMNQQNLAQQMFSQYQGLEEQGGKDYKGDFYGMLGSVLSQQLQEGAPDLDQYRSQATKSAKQGFNYASKKLKEDFSNRGTLGSGAAIAAQAQLGGQLSDTLAQNELGFSQMNEEHKLRALMNLMSLNQSGTQGQQQQFSNLFNLFQSRLNQQNVNREFQYKQENTPSPFGQFMGDVLGIGSRFLIPGI